MKSSSSRSRSSCKGSRSKSNSLVAQLLQWLVKREPELRKEVHTLVRAEPPRSDVVTGSDGGQFEKVAHSTI